MGTERVTVATIVGENILRLRKRGPQKMSGKVLIDGLRDYGIPLQLSGLVDIEKGRRDVNVAMLVALSDFFRVPIYEFFLPSAQTADVIMRLGAHDKPAFEILTDMVGLPPHETLEFRANNLAVEIYEQRGETPAYKALIETSKRT